DGQRALRRVLPDDVFIEEVADFGGARQTVVALVLRRGDAQLLLDDLVAQLDALVADVHAGPGDELLDLLLALPAEGALQQVGAFLHTCHERPHFPGRLASAVSGRAWPPRRLPGAT